LVLAGVVFNKTTANATCSSGNKFSVDNTHYNFSDFGCRSYPYHTARTTGSKCYDGTKSHIEVGFEVESDFYKLIDICFDDTVFTTLYSNFTLVSGINGTQTASGRPDFLDDNLYNNISINDCYNKTKQQKTINNILHLSPSDDKYINSNFLSRGHYTARADFVYVNQKNATFHFVNAAPQWQTFNAGNWNSLETSVRAYADQNKLTLDVYTGTHGVLTLPDINGNEKELYLYVDTNNNTGIPVPKLFWKAVYDPKTQAGTVFVGINNPYESNLQGDYLICKDVCSNITWIQWDQENIQKGYSYCCDVKDFRRTVKTLPDFNVTSLLT
jgi:hypothetical protein